MNELNTPAEIAMSLQIKANQGFDKVDPECTELVAARMLISLERECLAHIKKFNELKASNNKIRLDAVEQILTSVDVDTHVLTYRASLIEYAQEQWGITQQEDR